MVSQSHVASVLISKCVKNEYNHKIISKEIYIERIAHPTVLINSTTDQ